MDTDINQRYRVTDIPVDGKIAEIDDLVPYKNGNGFLRNVVVAVSGVLDTEAYLPLTLFGDDAAGLDPQLDLGRPLKCQGRLMSRKYLDRSGRMRWNVSVTATGVMLGPRPTMQPTEMRDADDPRNWPDENTGADALDDPPF
jgi:single-stranded DNA-binding protein